MADSVVSGEMESRTAIDDCWDDIWSLSSASFFSYIAFCSLSAPCVDRKAVNWAVQGRID